MSTITEREKEVEIDVTGQTCCSVALSPWKIDKSGWENHELGLWLILRLAQARYKDGAMSGVKQRPHVPVLFKWGTEEHLHQTLASLPPHHI